MKLSQVAAQLYTVRDFCQTAADLAATANRIRAIGYAAVQISGIGPIPGKEIVAIMQGEGLFICATHEPAHEILDEPGKVIDRLGQLGCKFTAYPFPRDVDFTNPAHVRTLVRKLDAAGAQLRAAGLTLGYHNHAIEFVKFEGAPALSYIFGQTNPQHLVSELDTFWIHYGGGDVAAWCRQLRGRLPAMHLKDYGFSPKNHPVDCGVGAGTLPFARIIAEAEAGGCQWFIVEQDTFPGSPFDSLRLSYDYIKANLVA
ncbi:MAG: sugar phosphate isomerase/epimerase [Opitutaceae bacterium]|nr:sugar phosphate isomerase/epimerase [Opitutaceae bacterium]